jgi:hypothetical protein
MFVPHRKHITTSLRLILSVGMPPSYLWSEAVFLRLDSVTIFMWNPLRRQTSSIRWTQLSRYHLITKTESSRDNILFQLKDWTMGIF